MDSKSKQDVKAPLSPSTAYHMGVTPAAGTARLHLNEMRHPHHPSVVAAAHTSECDIAEYTSAPNEKLKDALKEYLGVPSSKIILSAGSDEILRSIAILASHRGIKKAIIGVPSYTHFEVFAAQAKLEVVQVQMGLVSSAKERRDIYELHASDMKAGALVYIASPNNPTGGLWSQIDIVSLALMYPKSIFLVDEAYVEFEGVMQYIEEGMASSPTKKSAAISQAHVMGVRCSAAQWAATAGNIIVARTFSKAFGLAGLRIGYGIAGEGLIAELAPFISPKSVTGVAMRCALACLKSLHHYFEATAAVCINRLKFVGLNVYASGGNFALMYVGDSEKFVAAMGAAGIHVRDRSALPSLAGFVRVTIGTKADMEALRAAVSKYKLPDDPPLQAYYTAKAKVAVIRSIYETTVKILQAAQVIWWGTDGTLIGALRHGGMPPWDDDIDLGYVYDVRTGPAPSSVWVSGPKPPGGATAAGTATGTATATTATAAMTVPAATTYASFPVSAKPLVIDPVSTLVAAFAKQGLSLQRNRTNAYWQVGINEAGKKISDQHIDLFPYIQDIHFTSVLDGQFRQFIPETRFINADPRFQHADPAETTCNTYYTPEELFPLKKAKWYSGEIPVPNNGAAALDRAVPGWRDLAAVRGAAMKYPVVGHTAPA